MLLAPNDVHGWCSCDTGFGRGHGCPLIVDGVVVHDCADPNAIEPAFLRKRWDPRAAARSLPMSRPLRLSIVTATYKRPAELARCVAAIEAQTVTPWEHIIVGDGPGSLPEASWRFTRSHTVRNYYELGHRWTPFDRDRGGTAFWVGCTLATGDIVSYVPDDDEPGPEFVADVLDAFDAGADVYESLCLTQDGRQVHDTLSHRVQLAWWQTVNQWDMEKGALLEFWQATCPQLRLARGQKVTMRRNINEPREAAVALEADAA